MISEEMYQLAISKPLHEKIDKGVALMRNYNDLAKSWDMFEPWIHVCNSFGKDSVGLNWIAERAGVDFRLYHSLTTLDAPELIQFGREFYPDTIIVKPPKPLLKRMVEDEGQGPPTRIARWCCELYKENGCHGQIKAFGVRAQESHNRKTNWKPFQSRVQDRSYVINPILYFTDSDIWELIAQENIPYSPLYDEVDESGGKLFKRLGCVGCPIAGKNRNKEFKRWPKIHMAWMRAFDRFWSKWHGVPLLRPRWVSMEGKHHFQPLASEPKSRKYVKERDRDENGFLTYRRWYDLREFQTAQDLWVWWMEDEEDPEGCMMGLW